MALVREIVECLLDQSPGSFDVKCDNYEEALKPPKVTDGDPFDYVTGQYDPAVARFACDVKGVRFVRNRDNQMWRPKDNDDLVGVMSFAHSLRFRELGYRVCDGADRGVCREMVLIAISDLLNRDGEIDRLFARSYSDFGYAKLDFECLRDKLKNFRYAGFVCVGGRWKGIPHDAAAANPELASQSVCALGLMESFDMGMAMCHAYIDVPESDYKTILAVVHDRDAVVEQMLLASVRLTLDKDSIRLLMSPEKILSLRTVILQSPHELRSEAFRVMETILDRGMKHWARMCRNELVYLQIHRPLNKDLFHGVSCDAL